MRGAVGQILPETPLVLKKQDNGQMTRRQQIESLLEQDPTDPFLRYALAMEWASENAAEQALAHFDRLLQQDPGYIPAYLQAGQLRARLNQHAAARATLKAGIVAARQGHDEHAAEEMTALLQTLPDP